MIKDVWGMSKEKSAQDPQLCRTDTVSHEDDDFCGIVELIADLQT